MSLGTHSNWSSFRGLQFPPKAAVRILYSWNLLIITPLVRRKSSGRCSPLTCPPALGSPKQGASAGCVMLLTRGMIDGPQRANENLRRILRDGESTNSHRRNRRTAFPNPWRNFLAAVPSRRADTILINKMCKPSMDTGLVGSAGGALFRERQIDLRTGTAGQCG